MGSAVTGMEVVVTSSAPASPTTASAPTPAFATQGLTVAAVAAAPVVFVDPTMISVAHRAASMRARCSRVRPPTDDLRKLIEDGAGEASPRSGGVGSRWNGHRAHRHSVNGGGFCSVFACTVRYPERMPALVDYAAAIALRLSS
jgi:hypothetical protein